MATPTVPRTAPTSAPASAPATAPTSAVSADRVPQDDRASQVDRAAHHPHRLSRTRRIAAGLFLTLTVLFTGFPHGLAGSALWWSLDSGPFARSPRDVLTEGSPVGAVRVFGDHPGVDATTAARETVDALEAAGGLDRRYLSVDLPTGSGWVDPDQVEAIENWADGDIASVSVRYSSAPSAAVLVLRHDLAEESARALVTEVVDRVATRPVGDRPRIIVHGQSLGAAVGAHVLAEDPTLADAVAVTLWQGMPGGAVGGTDGAGGADSAGGSAPADRCTVSQLNADDPVGELSVSLATDPVTAFRVLTDLPGSENSPVGSGHSYGGVLPPAGCLD